VDKRSTYGLRIDQMAALFAVGSEDLNSAQKGDGHEKMAELLHEQLNCPSPESSIFRDILLMMIGQSGRNPDALTGKSLNQVLLSPQSDLDLLRVLKESCKTLSRSLDSEEETALATTIYFAALASALVFHQQKITQISYEKLEDSFALLREKQWMSSELIELFSQAPQICQSMRSKQ
jgi:hypothetical protein